MRSRAATGARPHHPGGRQLARRRRVGRRRAALNPVGRVMLPTKFSWPETGWRKKQPFQGATQDTPDPAMRLVQFGKGWPTSASPPARRRSWPCKGRSHGRGGDGAPQTMALVQVGSLMAGPGHAAVSPPGAVQGVAHQPGGCWVSATRFLELPARGRLPLLESFATFRVSELLGAVRGKTTLLAAGTGL